MSSKLVVAPAPTREAGVTTHHHHHYGFRPSVGGRILHCVLPCVLPTTPVSEYRDHPTADGWCGWAAYLCEGPPSIPLATPDWGTWPACLNCMPGYESLLIMEEMSKDIANGHTQGITAHQLGQRPALETLAVHPRLLELHGRGYVNRYMSAGADQFTYQLSPPVAHWFSNLPR